MTAGSHATASERTLVRAKYHPLKNLSYSAMPYITGPRRASNNDFFRPHFRFPLDRQNAPLGLYWPNCEGLTSSIKDFSCVIVRGFGLLNILKNFKI